MIEGLTWAAAQAIAKIALDKFVETGAGKLGEKLSEAVAAKIKALGEVVWNRLRGSETAVKVLEGAAEEKPEAVAALKQELDVLWQDEQSEFVKEVKQLATEIYQLHIGTQEGRNVMNVSGGQGLQVNDPQSPVIQAGSNNTFNFNYGSSPKVD